MLDNKKEVEKRLNELVTRLESKVSDLELQIESKSGCQRTNSEERFNSVCFFFIHNAFASICELKNNLKSRSLISSALIVRHLMELNADFKLLVSDKTKCTQYANAFYYYGEMRNVTLNKSAPEHEVATAENTWKKYRIGKNKYHWSGLDRTEVIRLAWNNDDSIYRALCAHCHVSLLTQDLVFWNYSERAIMFASADTDGAIGMVDEIFNIARERKYCGIKIIK